MNGMYMCNTILNNFKSKFQGDLLQSPAAAPPIADILLQLVASEYKGGGG